MVLICYLMLDVAKCQDEQLRPDDSLGRRGLESVALGWGGCYYNSNTLGHYPYGCAKL